MTAKYFSCLASVGVVTALISLPARGADLYWRTDKTSGIWTGVNWSVSALPTGGSAWDANSNAVFTADSTVTFATTDIGNVTVADGVTVTVAENGTLGTGGNIRTISVGSGGALIWESQTLSDALGEVGMGFIKDGAGTLEYGGF